MLICGTMYVVYNKRLRWHNVFQGIIKTILSAYTVFIYIYNHFVCMYVSVVSVCGFVSLYIYICTGWWICAFNSVYLCVTYAVINIQMSVNVRYNHTILAYSYLEL